jgi:hypothetical protein
MDLTDSFAPLINDPNARHYYAGAQGLPAEPKRIAGISNCYRQVEFRAGCDVSRRGIKERELSTQYSWASAIRHACRRRAFGDFNAGQVMVIGGERA